MTLGIIHLQVGWLGWLMHLGFQGMLPVWSVWDLPGTLAQGKHLRREIPV